MNLSFSAGLFESFINPPVLFFVLGIIAVLLKSDLEVPPQVSKLLSIYLLFDIGIKGGQELFLSGIHAAVIKNMLVCIVLSFTIPFLVFRILRFKLDIFNSAAIAAAYGSVSAVTFITATAFLETHNIPFNGYMVAGMAFMESPAIIAALLIVGLAQRKISNSENPNKSNHRIRHIFKEAFTNGAVVLLVGSLIIGYLSGTSGSTALKPFVNDIFKGVLSIYMLDMGLVAGARLIALKESGFFLCSFALMYPIIAASLTIALTKFLGFSVGNSLLLTILVASGSYIAVPAAMRLSIPQANMGLLLPMTLGVTFGFNVLIGIPLYYWVINYLH